LFAMWRTCYGITVYGSLLLLKIGCLACPTRMGGPS
jgi:hypothetical protein